MATSIAANGRKEESAGPGALLVLDFDGVICDSLPECFVSSWYAYHVLERGCAPDAVPRDAFSRFAALRPYIRSGEDYLLIHDLMRQGLALASQGEFDARIGEAGPSRMEHYKAILYQARETLLGDSPEYWCRLNPIYPHMREGLLALDPAANVFILSTKRAPFIIKILASAGVSFAEERVLYSGSRPKGEMIGEILGRTECRRAVFIDDQVDHFTGAAGWSRGGITIDCRLASWGYVRSEWLQGAEDYRVITPEEAACLLGGYSRRGGA